ncbi:guanosine monophosphate reductase [bacterium]|nr:guanosine monophosphate reductase [bacterium]
MQIQQAFTFDDVLLIPTYNHYESRRLVDISSTSRCKKLKLDLPIISSNMDTITESNMANFMAEKGAMGALHRFCTVDQNVEMFKKSPKKTFVSIGCSDKEFERVEALRDAGAQYFVIDVAHGHARYIGRVLKTLRKELLEEENFCIMAGNVATYAGADYLASCGADLIKVGIGGGSVCSTRIKTGFGVPTLSSIQQCARVDRSLVCDGGVRSPGDVVKALAFGADFVMMGGMLAGTTPTPGAVFTDSDGKKYKQYRGMASREAQEDFMGPMSDWKTAEGVATNVPYREDHDGVLADIIGGLRSGLTYGGASNIAELQKKLDYVYVSQAGRLESLPHKTF